MVVWLVIGVMIVLLVVLCCVLQRMRKQLKRACYIERRGDILLLKDYAGKIIEENIIIKIQ